MFRGWLYGRAMRWIAPLLGLDRWEVSAADDMFWRYDVAEAKWQCAGFPPDGCPDLDEWLSCQ